MKTRSPRGQALFVATAIALLLSWGPGVSRADQAPIRIAHVGATSGIFSSLGVGGKQAMEVWEDLVNARGGILGRPVIVRS